MSRPGRLLGARRLRHRSRNNSKAALVLIAPSHRYRLLEAMQIGFQLPASQHTPERKERTLSQSVPNLDGIKVAKKAKVVQLVL